MATCSRILAWNIPWTEEPDQLQPVGLQRLSGCMRVHTHTHTHHSKIPGLILGFTSQQAIWLAIITNSCEGPSPLSKET